MKIDLPPLSFTQCPAGDRLNKGLDQNLLCAGETTFVASHAYFALESITEKQMIDFHVIELCAFVQENDFQYEVPILRWQFHC